MADEYGVGENDFRADALLGDVLPEVLAHQDADRFFVWLRAHIMDYMSGEMRAEATPEMVRAFAYSFGRALWNSLPLPRNRFRPEPIPEPGRNEPCPCGSGLKYKRCCKLLPPFPQEMEDAIWPMLLDALSEEQREAALRGGALPRNALIALAGDRIDAGRVKSAVKLVEPLFSPRPVAHDEPMGIAFDLLCDAYDQLGWNNKKAKLIGDVIELSPRSHLRSDAWQRRCVIAMDRHDLGGARAAFRKSQRDDPEAPALAILEVQLLLAEHEPDKARERAGFHVRQLRRRGYPEDEPPLSFLTRVAADPLAAISGLALEMVGEAGRGLLDWLGTVMDRSVPGYGVAEVEALPEEEDDLVERLVQMGIARAEAERAVRDMPEQPPDEGPAEDVPPPEPMNILVGPEALATTERAWHEFFLFGKPFSVGNDPSGEVDVWEPAVERRWIAFLNEHPKSFDSLDILDDLAAALIQHPQFGLPALDQTMLLPLLDRTRVIVLRAVGGRDDIRLPWIESHNRPALRGLARLYMTLQTARPEEAVTVAEQVLELNPNDNHGYRGEVINYRLERGDNERALALAERYPDDLLAETFYGRALALFRLDRKVEATRALRDALKECPKVGDYLVREKPRRPKLSPFGVTYGGDDEAWLYREAMRGAWVNTPEAMDWSGSEHDRWRRSVGKNARKTRRP